MVEKHKNASRCPETVKRLNNVGLCTRNLLAQSVRSLAICGRRHAINLGVHATRGQIEHQAKLSLSGNIVAGGGGASNRKVLAKPRSIRPRVCHNSMATAATNSSHFQSAHPMLKAGGCCCVSGCLRPVHPRVEEPQEAQSWVGALFPI